MKLSAPSFFFFPCVIGTCSSTQRLQCVRICFYPGVSFQFAACRSSLFPSSFFFFHSWLSSSCFHWYTNVPLSVYVSVFLLSRVSLFCSLFPKQPSSSQFSARWSLPFFPSVTTIVLRASQTHANAVILARMRAPQKGDLSLLFWQEGEGKPELDVVHFTQLLTEGFFFVRLFCFFFFFGAKTTVQLRAH